MGKRKRGAAVNLDSFLDLMTCMLGILILMILLTGIDASQIKVLVPTPMEHPTDKRVTFIECRDNQLFLVSLDEINRLANDALKKLVDASKGDQKRFIESLSTAFVETDSYRIDLSFSLIGQYALRPKEGVEGYVIENVNKEKDTDWFGQIVSRMNPEEEILTFLVRDDSYNIFKKARAIAWMKQVQASCELLDMNEPLKFGLGGSRSYAQ